MLTPWDFAEMFHWYVPIQKALKHIGSFLVTVLDKVMQITTVSYIVKDLQSYSVVFIFKYLEIDTDNCIMFIFIFIIFTFLLNATLLYVN